MESQKQHIEDAEHEIDTDVVVVHARIGILLIIGRPDIEPES